MPKQEDKDGLVGLVFKKKQAEVEAGKETPKSYSQMFLYFISFSVLSTCVFTFIIASSYTSL